MSVAELCKDFTAVGVTIFTQTCGRMRARAPHTYTHTYSIA